MKKGANVVDRFQKFLERVNEKWGTLGGVLVTLSLMGVLFYTLVIILFDAL